MSFDYKNPISDSIIFTPYSVYRDSDIGTIFSVNSVGGYMEVYNLSDLDWVIPGDVLSNGGPVNYSGNSIPISFVYGDPTSLPIISQLNLFNDGISSGRRRLGMQVYVQETDTVYQYTIPDYTNLWNAAETAGSIFDLGTGYVAYNDTTAGNDFINAWTGSTIEGVSGATRNNSRWRIFSGSDIQITGGTYYSGTSILDLFNSTGGTITISGFTAPITGGTYNSGTQTLSLNSADGSFIDVTGFTSGSGSISVSANTGLGIASGNTLYTTYNTLLDQTLTMPYAVGGIPAGTSVLDLSGDTFVSLFNDLLFPTVQPTYTVPTISIGGVGNTLVEVGSTISLSLTATGVKNDAGDYTQLRLLRNGSVLFTDTTLSTGFTTNVPPQFGYSDPNNPNISFSISPSPYSESYVLPAPPSGLYSYTYYNADGNYNAGLEKQDNKGVYDSRSAQVRSVSAPQSASNFFQSTTYVYTSIYPYFWGVSSTQPTASGIATAISSGGANKVVLDASGTISITFGAASQYLWFAVYSLNPTKTSWYVDALNSGSIGGSTNLFASPVLQSVNSPDSYWIGINYDIYIGNYQTTTSGSMQLRN